MIQPDKIFGRLGNRLFQMAYIYARMKDGILPDIYLQDYRLFSNYEKEIKELFGEGIGFIPYVSIHLRRGDYVNNPVYVDLALTDYYTKAIALFPDKKFLVFSDDREFARKFFPDETTFQIADGTELEDLNMMASCESNILANSSFSWWAGFLNPNPSKTVIAPKEWFTDNISRVKIPPTWQKL